MKPVFGIDLGTTFSSIAWMTEHGVEMFRDNFSHADVPSVVYFGEGKVDCGRVAQNKGVDRKRKIYDSKRMLGKRYEDVQDIKGSWTFDVRPADNGMVEIPIPGRAPRKPYEVSAEVLKYLAGLPRQCGLECKDVVITVPASFNQQQRNETLEAAKLAGLNVLRLVHEPTAAAVSYEYNKKCGEQERTILVFDFGGGTLDLSLMKTKGFVCTVMGVGGDMKLGGRDFDNMLADYFIDKYGLRDRRGNPKKMDNFIKRCVECKEGLSESQEYPFFFDEDDEVPKMVKRGEFEWATRTLLDRIIPPVEKLLADNNVRKDYIDGVMLVGGSSRIPAVQTKLKEYFRKDPYYVHANPQFAVVEGAALMAKKIADPRFKGLSGLEWKEVCPLSIGSDCIGDRMCTIVRRGERIPCKKSSTFYTVSNFQTSLGFTICEGEYSKASKNRRLGDLTISGIRRAEVGEVPVTLTLELDESGMLKVIAESKNDRNGVIREERIVGHNWGYSSQEVDEMVKKADRERPGDEETVRRDKAKEDLRCLYKNIISYINEYRDDLGPQVYGIRTSAEKDLERICLRQVTKEYVEEERRRYRSMFQPFIKKTGRTPKCLS